MRRTEWKFKGHSFALCLNAAALTDIYTRFGTEKEVPELIEGTDRASFEATVFILWKLCEQGELVRRYEGHDRAPILGADYFRATLSPRDLVGAKRAIRAAVAEAFRLETGDGEEKEVDEILMEIQKKTKI